jgi:hypothetical protein
MATSPYVKKSLTSNGSSTGRLTVDDTSNFRIDATVNLSSSTQATVALKVVTIESATVFTVKAATGNVYNYYNCSAYLVADGATVTQAAQTFFGASTEVFSTLEPGLDITSDGQQIIINNDLKVNGTIASSSGSFSGTNTGDVTLAAVGSTPNANGASLSGQVLTLQPADSTFPGVVTTGGQLFAGAKVFLATISTGDVRPYSAYNDVVDIGVPTTQRYRSAYFTKCTIDSTGINTTESIFMPVNKALYFNTPTNTYYMYYDSAAAGLYIHANHTRVDSGPLTVYNGWPLQTQGTAGANAHQWIDTTAGATASMTFSSPVVNVDKSFQVAGSTTSSVTMTVKGASGQTANLQEWNVNGGSALSYVSKDGEVIPNSDLTLWLGTPGKAWRGIYGQFFSDTGSVSRVNVGANDSSVYTSRVTDGASAVAHIFDLSNTSATFTTAGAKLVSFRGISSSEKAYITKDGYWGAPLGATGTPSYTFTGDENTGMWSSAADTIEFSAGASNIFGIATAGVALRAGDLYLSGASGAGRLIMSTSGGIPAIVAGASATVLLSVRVSTNTEKAAFDGTSGKLLYTSSEFTNDSANTGNRTVNKVTGINAFAGGSASITITNDRCTATSLVIATLQTNDTTAVLKNVVPGSGTFTINLTASATGTTNVAWMIVN